MDETRKVHLLQNIQNKKNNKLNSMKENKNINE